jgi:hypothetical protein
MNREYNKSGFDFKKGYDKEIYEKLNEAEEWISSLHERLKNKEYQQDNRNPVIDKLLSCLGYFGIIRDKLKDELIFNRDSLRSLNIQVKRIEKDLETKRSELEYQVELRDFRRKDFETIKGKRDKADKNLSDYLDIQEEYYGIKKEKESAEETVRKNALIYRNNAQAIELMKVSSYQSKISIEQGKEILGRVEKAIEEIDLVYRKVMFVMSDKKKVLQITGGEDDTQR